MHFDFIKTIYRFTLWRALLILLVCGIMLYAGYYVDIAALQKQLAVSQQEEKSIKQEIDTLLYRQLALEERLAEFPVVKRKLDEWQRKFIKAKDLRQLLNEILAMGKTEKLQFHFFGPSRAVKEDTLYGKLPFRVAVLGGYIETAHFINQVAHLPWLVVIGDFTLVKFLQNDTQTLFATELVLDIYYLT